MAAFNKPQTTERRSLADIIMEKIKEKEQQLELVPKAMPGGAPGTLHFRSAQRDLKPHYKTINPPLIISSIIIKLAILSNTLLISSQYSCFNRP